jgi:hypothetical protein
MAQHFLALLHPHRSCFGFDANSFGFDVNAKFPDRTPNPYEGSRYVIFAHEYNFMFMGTSFTLRQTYNFFQNLSHQFWANRP